MQNAVGVIGVLLLLSLSLLVPAPVSSQSPISVQSSAAVADFPSRITFTLSAKSGVSITDVRLRYTIDRETFARMFSESFVEFTPAATVNVSWALDMLKTGGLPPGATLHFWWLIEDATGGRLETARQQVSFDDNRYRWRNVSQGTITLYWYQGDNNFATQLMTSAQQALTRLERDTGARLDRPVKLYIYAGPQDLQGSLIYPSEWTGGIAFPGYGIIAIGVATNNLAWGQRTVAHELTHLVVHQMTLNPYNGMPTWLDEGMAVYNEGPAEPVFTALLNQAIANNTLISLRSLISPFSAYSNEATLSYAESYSVVNYLIGAYGQAKMLELLNTFRQGSAYDDAFQKVYGFDMEGLYIQWKRKVAPSSTAGVVPPYAAASTELFILAPAA